MTKVLIVDDEYLQRELIKASVNWGELGILEVLEAGDGREALKLFFEYKPDIIIMDINIPYINGIEVSKKIKQTDTDVQILILTAYGEFDYAREAVEFGAAGFVLKPLNPEELNEKLRQAKENVCMRKIQSQNQKEQFLLECLSGLSDMEGREEKWLQYKLPDHAYICILEIKLLNLDRQIEWKEELEEYIMEQFPSSENIYIDKELLFFLFAEDTDSGPLLTESKSEEFKVKIRMLLQNLQEEFGAKGLAAGAASGIHFGVSELNMVYREAYGLMGKAVKNQKFYFYERQTLQIFMKQISYRSEEFQYCLKVKEYDRLHEIVRNCFEAMERDYYDSQKVVYVAMDILVNLASYLMGAGENIFDELEHGHETIQELSYQGKIEEIYKFIKEILDKSIDVLHRKTGYSNKKVEEAKRYIQENYYISELGLNLVAEAINMNSSYLSNIFKKEYGYALSRYIIQVRMERAADYISERPNAGLQDISEEVGYTDVYYFSKSFKNYYGISPSKFLPSENKM